MDVLLPRLGTDLSRRVARYLKPSPRALQKEIARQDALRGCRRVGLLVVEGTRCTTFYINETVPADSVIVTLTDERGHRADVQLRSEDAVAAYYGPPSFSCFLTAKLPKLALCHYVMDSHGRVMHSRIRTWEYRRDLLHLGDVVAEIVRLRVCPRLRPRGQL
jgi:hypothetical protein